MSPQQRELKAMGINPNEFEVILIDSDVIDIECEVIEDEDED
jgi:hypothetical protein